MNKIGFLLAIGAMAATASAEQISESQAMAVATKYMQLEQPNRQLVPAPRTATASSAAPYYVFNSSDGKGFIIVSGDDELTEIVGYSTDGFFDTANIPANAQAWLNKYADYVARVQSGDAVARKVQVSTLAETIVEPLVTTRWNQDAPYNNMCPIDKNYNRRSVTGCGATAMAQVMKYWEWPVQGQGEHQNANDPSLEVDFSESVYDWDNMLDTYNSLSSQTAQDAVAKLMYDCGVSIDMSYSYEASGAYDSDIAIALGTYFGYKAQTHLRDAYTVNAFRELIKSELDNARPVLFGGQGTVGGHEYVVDGYDSNDFLHINWGWGGASDGFYDMELMNPPSLGIGGGAGGFTEDQSIVTVQKDETMRGSTGQKSFNIYTMGEYGVNPQVDAAKKGDRIRIDVNNLWNITAHDFIGSVSVAVYDADFNRVAIAEGYSNLPLQGWNIIPELSFYLQDELEALADGEYTVWAVTKEDVGDGYDYDWIRVAMPEFTIMIRGRRHQRAGRQSVVLRAVAKQCHHAGDRTINLRIAKCVNRKRAQTPNRYSVFVRERRKSDRSASNVVVFRFQRRHDISLCRDKLHSRRDNLQFRFGFGFCRLFRRRSCGCRLNGNIRNYRLSESDSRNRAHWRRCDGRRGSI